MKIRYYDSSGGRKNAFSHNCILFVLHVNFCFKIFFVTFIFRCISYSTYTCVYTNKTIHAVFQAAITATAK